MLLYRLVAIMVTTMTCLLCVVRLITHSLVTPKLPNPALVQENIHSLGDVLPTGY